MSEIVEQIQKLKKQRNAVILGHNYQLPEVQDIADFVGDSLGLSLKAHETSASVIVFCGVRFMAETAAIISPDKTVLLPDAQAGCPLAEMISVAELRELKAAHPGVPVVCYINTNADVKAECDLCCTSANALEIVESLESEEVIFVPDKYLGSYVQEKTKKHLILGKGFCPTHQVFTVEEIAALKAEYPGALFMIHPETNPDLRAVADYVGGTGGMRVFARNNPGPFIVGTEVGMLHRLEQENPGKLFVPASERAVCPNMKKITLEKVLWALEDMQPVITVEEPTASLARRSIERMLAINTQ
ncbi:MAG TPA: quinolinate synthase NadA [bacterium]|nr:quinolinate synthase NadA [bacterium]